MAHTAAQDSNIPTAGPLFENTCGRRGCAHIFKYAGTDPFQSLAVLVAQHAPYCIGRIRISATHRCDTGWEPTAEILARFYNPVDDPAMFHSFGQCPPSDVMDVVADSELIDLSDDEATDERGEYDSELLGPLTTAPTLQVHAQPTALPMSTLIPTVNVDMQGVTVSLPLRARSLCTPLQPSHYSENDPNASSPRYVTVADLTAPLVTSTKKNGPEAKDVGASSAKRRRLAADSASESHSGPGSGRDSESESEFDADDSGDLVRSTSGAKPGRRRVKQELAPEDAPLKRAEGAGRSNGKHRNPGSAAQALRVITEMSSGRMSTSAFRLHAFPSSHTADLCPACAPTPLGGSEPHFYHLFKRRCQRTTGAACSRCRYPCRT
ncbi:hypothetical protein B0H14DRAFT_3713368 [Mycena olivaceomarginata]|nr:hypothetical protein B0H14DRAFT_3713368 [Mycena olivaceomarginata]